MISFASADNIGHVYDRVATDFSLEPNLPPVRIPELPCCEIGLFHTFVGSHDGGLVVCGGMQLSATGSLVKYARMCYTWKSPDSAWTRVPGEMNMDHHHAATVITGGSKVWFFGGVTVPAGGEYLGSGASALALGCHDLLQLRR